jgi:hypothetical protein
VDRDASMLHLGKAFRALFSAFEDQMQDAMKMALSRTADCRLQTATLVSALAKKARKILPGQTYLGWSDAAIRSTRPRKSC